MSHWPPSCAMWTIRFEELKALRKLAAGRNESQKTRRCLR